MNTKSNILLIGAPMDCGKRRQGCLMGPDSYRTAGLAEALRSLGHSVSAHVSGGVIAWAKQIDTTLPVY